MIAQYKNPFFFAISLFAIIVITICLSCQNNNNSKVELSEDLNTIKKNDEKIVLSISENYSISPNDSKSDSNFAKKSYLENRFLEDAKNAESEGQLVLATKYLVNYIGSKSFFNKADSTQVSILLWQSDLMMKIRQFERAYKYLNWASEYQLTNNKSVYYLNKAICLYHGNYFFKALKNIEFAYDNIKQISDNDQIIKTKFLVSYWKIKCVLGLISIVDKKLNKIYATQNMRRYW